MAASFIHIVCRYAAQYLEANKETLKEHSRFHKWKPTTTDEIQAFLALLLAMGLLEQIEIHEYWTTNCVTQTPFFPSVMSRDRFLLILTFLHFNDNNNFIPRGQPNYDPLYKLGDTYHHIIDSFPANYYPSKNIAIDEGLIPWRGNLHFRVYNPDKPEKFGLKSFELCDELGYVCQYELYTGRREDISNRGSTYDIVMRLIRKYLDTGHHLYCDNYYTSITLFNHLYKKKTLACGTMRLHRKNIPPRFKDEKLAKGNFFVMNNDPVTIMKYNDKRVVSLCSTIHKGEMIPTGRVSRATGEAVEKLDCVCDYNKFMGAVDRSDQMITYLCMRRKTMKWYKKVMFHMFDLCELQAYLLYKYNTEKPVIHRFFRRELIEQLIKSADLPKPVKAGKPSTSGAVLQRIQPGHFPDIKLDNNGVKLSKRCVLCTEAMRKILTDKGMKVPARPGHNTTYCCPDCDHVSLCITPCFRFWHTYRDYIGAYKKYVEDKDLL